MPRDVEGSIAQAILHEYELLAPRHVVIDKVSDPLAKHFPAILQGRLRTPRLSFRCNECSRDRALRVGTIRRFLALIECCSLDWSLIYASLSCQRCHRNKRMRQIGPSLVDDGLGESYSGETAIVELLEPEAGKRHHLGQGERRKLEAVVAIDRFPIAQGSRCVAAPHVVGNGNDDLIHGTAVVFPESG